MKKKLLCIVSIVLFIGLVYYLSLPDFIIHNSMSFSYDSDCGQIRDTDLRVIVYKYFETESLIEDIEEEHNEINGTPSSLEINLYHSKWELTHGIGPYHTSKIEYE